MIYWGSLNNLTIFSLSLLLISISAAIAFILILFIPPQNQVKKAWALFNINVLIWAFTFLMCSTNDYHDSSLFWMRFSNLSGLYIAVIFFHFICLLTDNYKKRKKLIYFFYIFETLFFGLCLSFPELFIPKVKPILEIPFYPHPGMLYFLFPTSYAIIISKALIILHTSIKNTELALRTKFNYVFWGYIVATLGGFTCFLPVWDIPIYPYGNYFVVVYIIAITYSILKHQLLDIQIVFKKSLIYTTLIALITLTYLLIVMFLEWIVQEAFGYQSKLISITVAFSLGAFIFPLRNKIQRIIDQLLFKATPAEIDEQNQLLRKEVADKQKHQAVAQLASSLAHEIRNPLTSIKAFCEHVRAKKDDTEFIDKFSNITKKEIGRIESLTQQLLDFAKPSPPNLKPVNVNELIDDVTSLIENKLQQNKITLKKELTESLPETQADANQLKQTFLNIILNAIDAMPDGGNLTISTEAFSRKPIAASNSMLDAKGYKLEAINISITDTGCGIAQDKLATIFDPFVTNKESGTGLGLSICKGIIEEHGGKISVTSDVNHGTIFMIRLTDGI